MNAFVSAIKDDATTIYTENGAKTYSTSFDSCVDLFFQIGAIRGQGAARAETLFRTAYKQNPDLATKIALWARDVRGGAGERQVFRDLLKLLEKTDMDRLARILPLVPEIGRYDDLFVFETATAKDMAFAIFGNGLVDPSKAGLAAKWAPRETGAKKKLARELMAYFELSPKNYRRLITTLSNTVEQQMSARLWDDIEFQKVPSVAAARYAKAFRRHQPDRYNEFVQKAVKGEVKINASALFPYDVTKSTVDAETQNALWNQLPDYVPAGKSFIPMIDLSQSMSSSTIGDGNLTPMDAAISLGLYLAEKNKSEFNRMALAFAGQPSWISIPDTDSVRDKVRAVKAGQVAYDTNLNAAFEAILSVALRKGVPQEDLPDALIVLSDMEFNSTQNARSVTNVDAAKRLYEANGYRLPTIVWWNLQSRNGVTPVRADASGMVLVSGLSPSVTTAVLGGEATPVAIMLKAVDIARYEH
jgi:hypothetical protein